jgi:predicted NAD/FAD-dependent oxidoreductase
MSGKIENKKIAIIGAGIAGLTIAKKLANFNQITIFDKSRGIGGRMATKRTDNYHFDHGAQFFTAKSKKFKNFCQQAKNDGIIEDWNCNFAEIDQEKITRKWQFNDKKPHFVAKPQMNSLCKYIAKDLNIELKKQIQKIDFSHQKWSLTTSEDEVFNNFDYLIIAIPSHQAINLVPKNFKYFDIISKIKMLGCFTLMLGFKQKITTQFEAALVKKSIISWISVNSSKPERPKAFSLVVNSSNKWADENIEEDLDIVKEKMTNSLNKIVKFDLDKIKYHNIHRWKYANSPLTKGRKSLFDPNINLGLCGDWFISGRVENAFLSALDLHDLLQQERWGGTTALHSGRPVLLSS